VNGGIRVRSLRLRRRGLRVGFVVADLIVGCLGVVVVVVIVVVIVIVIVDMSVGVLVGTVAERFGASS